VEAVLNEALEVAPAKLGEGFDNAALKFLSMTVCYVKAVQFDTVCSSIPRYSTGGTISAGQLQSLLAMERAGVRITSSRMSSASRTNSTCFEVRPDAIPGASDRYRHDAALLNVTSDFGHDRGCKLAARTGD